MESLVCGVGDDERSPVMSDDKKAPEQDAPEARELKQEELDQVHGGAVLEFQIPEKIIQKSPGVRKDPLR